MKKGDFITIENNYIKLHNSKKFSKHIKKFKI